MFIMKSEVPPAGRSSRGLCLELRVSTSGVRELLCTAHTAHCRFLQVSLRQEIRSAEAPVLGGDFVETQRAKFFRLFFTQS